MLDVRDRAPQKNSGLIKERHSVCQTRIIKAMDIQTELESPQPTLTADRAPEQAESNRKEPRIDNQLLKPSSPPTVTVTETLPENEDGPSQTKIVNNADGEMVQASKVASLTPSGPPESHQQFSMQEFKRSFYRHWMKDRSVERSNPYGFSSANASPSQSRPQSPTGCSYAEGMARKGSLGGAPG